MEIIEFLDENNIKHSAKVLLNTNIGDINYVICQKTLETGDSQLIYVKIELNDKGDKIYSLEIDETDREKLNNLVLALIKEGSM